MFNRCLLILYVHFNSDDDNDDDDDDDNNDLSSRPSPYLDSYFNQAI